jgi:hypothetical protein
MKYSQFAELMSLLEKHNISLDEWKKNPSLSLLKETEGEEGSEGEEKKELDTKKGNILTRRGRQRSALNKQAKKLQEQINKDIADKFLKPIFDLKIRVYKKMAEMGKGKQPKEILAALKVDLGNIQKTQSKQMKLIEQSAQKAIDIMTQKIDSTIDKGKLSDTSKANMKTYWSLLTTQIMMNLLQKIAVKDDTLIGETIKDKEIIKAAKAINKAVNKEFLAQQGRAKQKTDETKKKVEAADAEPEEGDDSKVAEEYKPGEKYKYKDDIDGDVEITITEVSKKNKGGIKFSFDKDGEKKERLISKKDFKEKNPEKIEVK